jgi:hypothetical protein
MLKQEGRNEMARNRSGSVFLMVLAVVFFGGCGGRQASTPTPCENGYGKIMEHKDAEVCDPQQMNLFEMQVTKWREDCKVEAKGDLGKKVATKFDTAQSCSESKRRIETMHSDCKGRLTGLSDGSASCLADACAPFSNDLGQIAKTCDTKELNGAFTAEIADLKAKLDERTNDAERLGELGRISAFCDQFVEMPDEKQATAAVDQILKEASASEYVKETPKAGSEAERYKRIVSSSCDNALGRAVEVIIPTISAVIENNKVVRTSKKWGKEFDKLSALQKRLTDAGGSAFFPTALPQIETTIAKYAQEGTAVGAATVKTDSTPAGSTTTTTPASPAVKPMTEGQCKALKKKALHYAAKVDEYVKKGNTAKVNAYQGKLDEADRQLASCGEEASPEAETESSKTVAPAEPVPPSAPSKTAEPTKPVEAAKTAETKTVEQPKPAEQPKAGDKTKTEATKPAETKPAETKPAEQPKAGDKPKAEATKPAETKPAEQPKTGDKPKAEATKPAEQPKAADKPKAEATKPAEQSKSK